METLRRCIVLRGDASETAAAAARLTASTVSGGTLWVGPLAPERTTTVPARQVRKLLGRSFESVVLDLTEGVDPDLLGQAQGFIVRGGALVLRLPAAGRPPKAGRISLAVPPFSREDVGLRFWRRLEEKLARPWVEDQSAPPLTPSRAPVTGTREQARAAEGLASLFTSSRPQLATLLSDRGRGKSSALGLAIARAAAQSPAQLRDSVVVTASDRAATREVFHHCGPDAARFVSPSALLREPEAPRVIVVDEAAQLPVPWLRALVGRYPRSTIAFATTTRGYEGTGRGFVLRFIEELNRDPRPLCSYSLEEPIRWDPNDRLEALIFDLLALDATAATGLTGLDPTQVVHREVAKDELVANESLLRDFFGLLVHAHYRTAPSDLHRILDAPNLRLHASFVGDRVVGACLVALEGELSASLVAALFRGNERIRGHALPETLVSHSGVPEAGTMSFIRSVRIAVSPELRRGGIATGLAEHVHESYAPDFFGTLFGATPGLIAFRRSLGYELVRVGSSRGIRTGEPTAVMVRPATPRAEALLGRLRGALARDLEAGLALAEKDGELPLAPDLLATFRKGLPAPAPLSTEERAVFVERYATGGATYDSARGALEAWLRDHRGSLDDSADLDETGALLIRLRIEDRRGWDEICEVTGHPTVPGAMRALRRAVRALWLGKSRAP
ncbi:MAG: tRNA(Met) cytidine acetyltransferase [Deltaproteobacteria bacterium]|nr:tRNA(Met) cytidine acetyltransferase [Deltaproteobacteria bacterium]